MQTLAIFFPDSPPAPHCTTLHHTALPHTTSSVQERQETTPITLNCSYDKIFSSFIIELHHMIHHRLHSTTRPPQHRHTTQHWYEAHQSPRHSPNTIRLLTLPHTPALHLPLTTHLVSLLTHVSWAEHTRTHTKASCNGHKSSLMIKTTNSSRHSGVWRLMLSHSRKMADTRTLQGKLAY